jgi:hypothetical protein
MSSQISVYEKQLVREIRETPAEYWPSLLQLIRLFRESVTLKPAEASFRQGWQEAMNGQTRPLSELWEDQVPAIASSIESTRLSALYW